MNYETGINSRGPTQQLGALWIVTLLGATVLLLGTALPAKACHDGSPLLLDLNGDGVRTTDYRRAVEFDLDGDGTTERVAWTMPDGEEAFLALDLDGDRRITSGRELFGDGTILPDGTTAAHGFEALAVYDTVRLGGNEDGVIDADDSIWEQLWIWVDRSHDGISQRREMRKVARSSVRALSLEYVETGAVDGNLNTHRYQGSFVKRERVLGGPALVSRAMDDVFFRIVHEDHQPSE